MLQVSSNIIINGSRQPIGHTTLSLLDLSAAFDCSDHLLLLLDAVVSNRTNTICRVLQQVLGYTSAVLFGVPQGSQRRTLLYLLYTAALLDVIGATSG